MKLDRLWVVRALAVAVSAGGLLEMLAWFAGIEALTSVSAAFVTMKFSTALSFFLGGVILFFIAEAASGRFAAASVVLPVSTLVLLLFMVTLIASSVFRVVAGVEAIFVREAPGAVLTAVPGRPSVVTVADFMVLAAAGVSALFKRRAMWAWMVWGGVFVAATGLSASAGYALGVPEMYFSLPWASSAMALPTAVLFIAIGAGLCLVPRRARA